MRRIQQQKHNLCIFIGDVTGIVISYFIATYFRFFGLEEWQDTRMIIARLFIALIGISFAYTISYPNRNFFNRSFSKEILSDIKTNAIVGAFVATTVYLLADAKNYSRLIYLGMVIFSTMWMIITHAIYKRIILESGRIRENKRRMLIVTTRERAKDTIQNILREQAWDIYIVGLVLLDQNIIGETISGIKVVADQGSMADYVVRDAVDEVFIHLPYDNGYPVKEMIEEFEEMGIIVSVNLHLYDMDIHTRNQIERLGTYYAASFGGNQKPLYQIIAKRAMDIAGAFVGLILTGIVSVILFPLLKLDSPGPLLFSQERVGKNGRRFRIYKFRSMYIDAEARKKELMEKNEMKGLMFKMENDPRITKIGKFIRKTSIDELPQFWNVLRGDMSLVGTRPPTVDEFNQYESHHKKRLSAKPGMTGVWQVSGRSDIKDFDEVVAMDVDYIANWTLFKDVKILFQTVQVVIMGSGAK